MKRQRVKSSIVVIAIALCHSAMLQSAAMAADFRSEFPPQYTDTPMGVNLQTGKFRYWPYSFSMGPFQLERGFNKSGFQFLGSTYVRTLQAVNGAGQPVRTVSLGDLNMDFYDGGNGHIWYSTTSVGWKLKSDQPGFTLTDRSGTTYKFTEYGSSNPPKARVTLITYADGSTISVSYDTSDRVTFIESNRGYAMRYEYLNGGAQVKVCGFNRTATYATATTSCSSSNYSLVLNGTVQSGGDLQINSVVDLGGLTSTLTYTANSLLQCMTLPGSSTCGFNNTYGPQPGEATQLTKANQVRIQTDANGNTYTYGYDNGPTGDDPPKYPGGPPVLSAAWMNGPGYSVQGNYEDGLLKELSAPGGGPAYFEYDGVNLKKARYLDGRIIDITRDYFGNALNIVENPKPNSGATAISRTQTFPAANLYANPTLCQAASEKLCDKPIAQVDARTNQTDYIYDPAHGAVLTATLPAGLNGIRPQTRYEYAQRYAWVMTSGGGYVPASSPIWVKTRERFCRTTAASGQSCAGGAADEVVTDFEYGPDSGPNNLLLRGVAVTADGQTRRTCYSYDANGRKVSETQPKAGLAVCL